MTRYRFVPAVLLFFTLALLPAPGESQDIARWWEFTPKAETSAGFEEALKAHMEYRASLGDPWTWEVFEVAVGEDVGTFQVGSWGHTWADFDAYEAWDGATAAGAHFGATVSPLLEDMTSTVTQDNAQITRPPPDPNAAPNLVNVTTFYLNPGQISAFNENLMKFHEAIGKAELPFYYASSSLVAGGRGPTFTIVGFADNWAGFADPDPGMEQAMMEMYGEEEAMEIFSAFGESYRFVETFIARHRTDLSTGGGM